MSKALVLWPPRIFRNIPCVSRIVPRFVFQVLSLKKCFLRLVFQDLSSKTCFSRIVSWGLSLKSCPARLVFQGFSCKSCVWSLVSNISSVFLIIVILSKNFYKTLSSFGCNVRNWVEKCCCVVTVFTFLLYMLDLVWCRDQKGIWQSRRSSFSVAERGFLDSVFLEGCVLLAAIWASGFKNKLLLQCEWWKKCT